MQNRHSSFPANWEIIPEKTLIAVMPDSVHELLKTVPVKAIISISEARGGTSIYIPVQQHADNWLSRLIGLEAACALSQWRGGERWEVPRLEKTIRIARNIEIVERSRRGDSQATLALDFALTVRQVRNIQNIPTVAPSKP